MTNGNLYARKLWSLIYIMKKCHAFSRGIRSRRRRWTHTSGRQIRTIVYMPLSIRNWVHATRKVIISGDELPWLEKHIRRFFVLTEFTPSPNSGNLLCSIALRSTKLQLNCSFSDVHLYCDLWLQISPIMYISLLLVHPPPSAREPTDLMWTLVSEGIYQLPLPE